MITLRPLTTAVLGQLSPVATIAILSRLHGFAAVERVASWR